MTPPRSLPWIALLIIALVYFHNTLPYLTMLPRVNVDEPWLMERAYQVLTEGIPNQPMLRLERPYFLQVGYDYLYAPWFAAFGVGMLQARLLSVFLGFGAVLCVYGIGRRIAAPEVGLAAAAFLVADSNFLGNARTSRTDMPSVFFATLALYAFLRGRDRGWLWHVIAGASAGLAMLCHGNAYWVVIVLLAWYFATYGFKALVQPPLYWCALGGTITFGPYLAIVAANWAEVQVQIGNFAGDRAPGLSPATIWEHVTRELARYRGWHFGLITNDVPNPFLLAFQAAAAAGLVFVVVQAAINRAERVPYALLATLAVGLVVIFAGFIPNKAHVYMPNIVVGLSLAAGAFLVWACARMWRRGMVVATMLAMTYALASVAYYERWYASQRKSELTPYETVERAVEELVPAGPKDVFASPNLWVPFHADEGVTFVAYTGATPRQAANGYRLDGFGEGRPIYLLIDESEWKTVATDPAGGYTAEWRQSWAGFITHQCAVRAIAYGSAYGNLVSYECANDVRPAATEPVIVGDGQRYRLGSVVWAPSDEELASLPPYVDPRRSSAASLPTVEVEQDAVRIAGSDWPGIHTHLRVVPGEPYVLLADAVGAHPGDIAMLGRWDEPQVTTLFGAGAAGLFLPLAETSWFPGDRAFIATAPQVWLRIYSEAPSADFRVRSIALYALEPIE